MVKNIIEYFRILLNIQFIICLEPNPFLLNFVTQEKKTSWQFYDEDGGST